MFVGVDGLSRKIQEVKDFVDERVEALSRKQDSLADSQDEMKDQLEDVQENIHGVSCSLLCCCCTLGSHCNESQHFYRKHQEELTSQQRHRPCILILAYCTWQQLNPAAMLGTWHSLLQACVRVQMRSDIKTIEGDMKEFKDNQMYTNEGIYTMCSVLKEIMTGQGQKSRGHVALGALDKFLNRTKKLPMHQTAVCASGLSAVSAS